MVAPECPGGARVQGLLQAVSVEYVVAQDQRHAVAADEVGPHD